MHNPEKLLNCVDAGVGVTVLTPLSTISQLYRGCQFYWWSTKRKLPTCHKSLTNFITMLYQVHLTTNGIQTHNFSVWLISLQLLKNWRVWIGIPLTGLTLPYLCACFQPRLTSISFICVYEYVLTFHFQPTYHIHCIHM